MVIKKHISAAILGFVLLTGTFCLYAQNPADAVAEVPELVEFHEVIHKIWHDAWPNKNIAMLKDLLPGVEEGISNVVSARLPGILRGKKEAWEEGIAKLKAAGVEYKAAAETEDDARLMDAAEALHDRFAVLMRLTRPALRELEDFHSSLYMLFHHYLPDYDLDKIRSSAEELSGKMQILNAAKLPDRLQPKEAEFMEAVKNLGESVKALQSITGTGSEETIKAAINELHTRYQAVHSIVD